MHAATHVLLASTQAMLGSCTCECKDLAGTTLDFFVRVRPAVEGGTVAGSGCGRALAEPSVLRVSPAAM